MNKGKILRIVELPLAVMVGAFVLIIWSYNDHAVKHAIYEGHMALQKIQNEN